MSATSFWSTRAVGDIRVTIIDEGRGPFSIEPYSPPGAWRGVVEEAGDTGVVTIGSSVGLIQTPDATIVIDPGFDDPRSAWWQRMAVDSPHWQRTPGFQAALDAIGVQNEAVDVVIISHAHFDHVVGVMRESGDALAPRFPNARHLIGRGDWEGNPRRSDPSSFMVERLEPIDRAGLLELVDDERVVVPGVTVIPAPGETPGHMIVHIESAGKSCYLLGDLLHHPMEFEHPDWNLPWADPVKMRATRDTFFGRAADDGALVSFPHALFPGWGAVERVGSAYRWIADE